jgi:hypothetical protein
MSMTREVVQQEHQWGRLVAPTQVMQPQSIDVNESLLGHIDCLRGLTPEFVVDMAPA